VLSSLVGSGHFLHDFVRREERFREKNWGLVRLERAGRRDSGGMGKELTVEREGVYSRIHLEGSDTVKSAPAGRTVSERDQSPRPPLEKRETSGRLVPGAKGRETIMYKVAGERFPEEVWSVAGENRRVGSVQVLGESGGRGRINSFSENFGKEYRRKPAEWEISPGGEEVN